MNTFYVLVGIWALAMMVAGGFGVHLLWKQGEPKVYWLADLAAVVMSAFILGAVLHMGGVI